MPADQGDEAAATAAPCHHNDKIKTTLIHTIPLTPSSAGVSTLHMDLHAPSNLNSRAGCEKSHFILSDPYTYFRYCLLGFHGAA